MNEARHGTMCFSVTGEHLTTLARDFVLSEEYDRAENMLLESLHGISHEQVHSVLSGECRLMGVNRLGIEDDPDSEDYQRQVAYLYSGRQRLQHNGSYTWWKPTSYWKWTSKDIVSFNYDLNTSRNNILFQPQIGRPHTECTVASEVKDFQVVWVRSQYCQPGEILRSLDWEEGLLRDVIGTEDNNQWVHMRTIGRVLVFFSPCDPPPPWLKTKAIRQSPFLSFLDALKAGRIRPRGWNKEEEPLDIKPLQTVQIVKAYQKEKLAERKGGSYRPAPEKDPKESWPVWDGKGAYPAQPPSTTIPSLEEAVLLLQRTISEERIAHTREQIRRQADDSGWMEFPWGNRKVRVPQGAFECWALRRTIHWRDATPWKVMSGAAWKQLGDDPYHTDWMLGAGLDLELWHEDKTLQDAAYDARHKLQYPEDKDEPETFKATILVAPARTVVGQVIHPKPDQGWFEGGEYKVIMLPNLSPRYALALQGASLVIAENGGALAHLSQVGREQGVPVLRLQHALTQIPEGTWVRVETQSGVVEILDDNPGAET